MKRLVLLFVFLVTMSRIDYAIPSQAYELIRDRIGEILTDEVANQIDLSYDVDLNAVVLIEDRDPIDKVQLNAIVVSLATGQYSNKNQGSSVDGGYLYFIDIYTNAKERFNKSGSYRAATVAHKLSRYVRCILEHQEYKTLGYQPGFVMRTGFVEFNIRDVTPSTDSLSTYMIRMVFKVDANEITNAKVPNLIDGYDTRVDVIYQYEGNTDTVPVDPCDCDMTADFSASSTEITQGDSVSLTDLTNNNPTNWYWRIVNGSDIITSTSQNPSIVLNNVGTADVFLMAAKDGAGDIITKSAYISVSLPLFEPEATILFAKMASIGEEPDITRKMIYNQFYIDLKNANGLTLGVNNIYTIADCIHVYSSHSENAGKFNLVKDDFHATYVGAPLFTTDRGVTGATGKYILLDYNPSIDAFAVSRNDYMAGVYCRNNIQSSSAMTIGCTDNTRYTYIRPRNASNQIEYVVNDDPGGISSNNNSSRLVSARRTNSNTIEAIRDGVSLGSASVASVGLPNKAITVLAFNGNSVANFSTNEAAASIIVKSSCIINGPLTTLLTSIGAAV